MHRGFRTPQSDDGAVTEVGPDPQVDGALRVEIAFELEDAFRAVVREHPEEIVFVSRSRLARLGIDVEPVTPVEVTRTGARLTARIVTTVPEYGIEEMLPAVILPELRMGRLVFCDERRRLSAEDIHRAVEKHEFQLPRDFSIDASGRFIIRPHRIQYDLAWPLSTDQVLAILTQREGRQLLNRVQVPRKVENLVIQPGRGLITSCSMFLHRHFVVLDREATDLGKHLQSIVLDPVATRGTRVFLEISNASQRQIVNPSVAARIYDARPPTEEERTLVPAAKVQAPPEAPRLPGYDTVAAYFDGLGAARERGGYLRRTVAAVPGWDAIAAGDDPVALATGNGSSDRALAGAYASYRDYASARSLAHRFGTSVLRDLREDEGHVVLLEYFPNLIEHIDLCNALVDGRVREIVFRKSSFEHGQFFSANDHARLADYEALGARVHWCNDDRKHVATHVYRDLRGFFTLPENVERFKTSLIVAIYGSAAALTPEDEEGLRGVIGKLKGLFGGDVSILTGGGPGSMMQATQIAKSLGLFAGANYIETIDQPTNQLADFYQCFQDRNRHNRQRWFEVASFSMFCVGGLGTLEEIGLTLTDMKLGLVEPGPLVFFGRGVDGEYWRHLYEQLDAMVRAGRAPRQVLESILVTSDPERMAEFYKQVLQLG